MLHGHEPNQRGYLLQPAATEITGKSHPDILKALVGELKRRDLFYLTKNLISDQEEGNGNAQPYILRKYVKQNRLGVGDLKIVKKDDVTSEAADAQVKRDSLHACKGHPLCAHPTT